MVHFTLGVVTGAFIVAAIVIGWLWATSNPHEIKAAAQQVLNRSARKLPPGVRRGSRPDTRRVVLRPVNIDQPPSRVTQALFRSRPVRKLDDDETHRR